MPKVELNRWFNNLLSEVSLSVYITHFIDPDISAKRAKQRMEYLATEILYLSMLDVRFLRINVISNKSIVGFDELAKPILARGCDAEINNHVATDDQVSENGRILNWLLTWVHKSQMKTDVESRRGDLNSYYLYLEDDALFTDANLRYFIDFLPTMKKLGLIPGFIRSEWSSLYDCWTHPDSFSRLSFDQDIYEYPFDSSFKLIQRENPYSASILLDQSLAEEYFQSESSVQQLACYKHPIIFDIGSTAALGLICENVPEGYKIRTALVCNSSNFYPVPGSVIRHLDDRYGNDIWQTHFRLFEDRISTPLHATRTFWNYFLRLRNPDRFSVFSKYISKLVKRFLYD